MSRCLADALDLACFPVAARESAPATFGGADAWRKAQKAPDPIPNSVVKPSRPMVLCKNGRVGECRLIRKGPSEKDGPFHVVLRPAAKADARVVGPISKGCSTWQGPRLRSF